MLVNSLQTNANQCYTQNFNSYHKQVQNELEMSVYEYYAWQKSVIAVSILGNA